MKVILVSNIYPLQTGTVYHTAGGWDRYSDKDSGRDRYSSGGRNSRKPGDWDCPSCKFINYASRTACLKCRIPKDVAGGDFSSPRGGGGGGGGSRPGDWDCPSCSFSNYAHRGFCYRCKVPREGGRARPGDWECSDCKFLNFASRSQCMKCSSRKCD